MNMTFEDFSNLFDRDPAFVRYCSGYKPRAAGEALKACPALNELNLIEATLWDNGVPSKKTAGRSSAQYSLKLKGWKAIDADLYSPDWNINVPLMTRDKFISLFPRQFRNGSISQAYFDALTAVMEQSQDDRLYFGQFYNNNGGQTFFDKQYCILQIIESEPSTLAIVNGEFIPNDNRSCVYTSTGWVEYNVGGRPLADKIKAQLRWNLNGVELPNLTGWATVAPTGGE